MKLNEVGEAGTALKNIEVAEIYSRSSQGGQAGSEHAGGAAGSYLMFLGDGGHLRWGSVVIGDLCDGGPESRIHVCPVSTVVSYKSSGKVRP